jgi:hypothetical protein
MNTNLSPVLDILYGAETAQKEGCSRVCELLSRDLTSTITRILIENENQLGDESFRTLLEKVGDIVKHHKVQRNITDWPFENFWNNPHEPYHSKLLRYFINPDEEHRCGPFLLGKFLSVLRKALVESKGLPVIHEFPVDECSVEAETRDVQPGDNQSGQIDLLITRQCDNRNYAIIVENKINRAANRPKQLQKYVARARRAGFSDEQIFVFFLPLTDDLYPESDDLKAIPDKVTYAKITFEKHIRAWLKAALEEWPANLDERIREHLSYYRNLINHLINQREQDTMDASILKQLEQAEHNNTLPTWQDVERARTATEALKRSLEQVIRGRLLLETCAVLSRAGKNAWLCLENHPLDEIDFSSAYDPRFGQSVDLCLQVDDAVRVCYGGNSSECWFGYMRNGSAIQDAINPVIRAEAEKHLVKIKGSGDPWYAWGPREVTYYYDKRVEDSSEMLAEALMDMCNSLVDRLKKEGVRS